MNVAVLMTCHNRRESTLRCLDSLHVAVKEWELKVGVGEWKFDIFLVDDGSTDGTAEEVRKFELGMRNDGFGIHIVKGTGRDFWAKGMARAWQAALDYEKSHSQSSTSTPHVNCFLWLNDDTVLSFDSLSASLRLCVKSALSFVIAGELVNARGEVVYGKRGDLFTGNFVLVPRAVYEKVGMLCGDFRHAWADSDYAMRCKRAGVPVVSCGVVGTCEGHPNRPSLVGLSMCERWAMLWNPKGWCVHDLWLYRKRNWGLVAAVVSCAHLVCHVVFLTQRRRDAERGGWGWHARKRD